MRKELKRWTAERFFERELDEDYYMGAREGQRIAKAEAKHQIETAGLVTAKKNHPGLALALEALK